METTKQIIPARNFLIVELIEGEKSAVILPDGIDLAKTGKARLKVISTGKDCKEVKPGDYIIQIQPQLAQFIVDDVKYLMTREDNVSIIIREEEVIADGPQKEQA